MGLSNKNYKYFDGTIIIGDPCAMTKNDDWHDSGCGERFDLLGFKNYLYIQYEEFAPTVVDDKNNVLGRFCTDSGIVMVVLLDELTAYNPDFEEHLTHPENWTVIKNFKGRVESGKRFGKYFIKGKGNINFKAIYETD